MPLIWNNGQLLFRNGQLAFSRDCCCEGDCCSQLPDTLTGTYTNGCGTVVFTFEEQIPIDLDKAPSAPCVTNRQWKAAVVITCNQASDGGDGVICDNNIPCDWYLNCAVCPETQINFYWHFDCCPENDLAPICFPPPSASCGDTWCFCDSVLRERTVKFGGATNPDTPLGGDGCVQVALPCPCCFTGACDCNTLTITW